ncbi:MAG: hypothetical protein GXP50_09550, partial [Deltaproteobacteria bacterium]|nr:hypothetical protein [Deltaproteobacteria bacterium]
MDHSHRFGDHLDRPLVLALAAVSVLAVGAAYGAALAWTQRSLGIPVGDIPAQRIPFQILLLGNLFGGIGAVAAAHFGGSIVLWLMGRAVGGPGRFGRMYRGAALLLWAALPALPAV